MQPHDQLWQLTNRLTKRTTSGKLSWHDAGETQYQARLQGGTVTVRSRDGDGQHPYIIDVLNPEGVLVDSADSMEPDDEEVSRWGRDLEDLWQVAHRQAGGAQDVLNALLKETDDDDIPF